ncbi:TonB-dependent receptor family protein [Rheinheimera nanhaiensis]|uniref:Iron complex outermembrane recepter protein n=1 Tax=Rheinheimera nanhaiensis E407-8 TaxID=562729 RepID=I1DXB8_9GAMM|nr:TonB-dependent receptor [Rheinheimera nanhaiensis]GAB58696.1 iron complex outermembrane recepter protein [Rheinheimera nanhaiensis E407-8]
MQSLSFSLLTVALLPALTVQAETDISTIERISILGSQQAAATVPGSASYISQQELEQFSYTDISRVLATTPGVYVQEEDGYGLRPNIGMRGTGTGRNDKITVMEDGVLIAPAPYVAPAAYYFPTTGRLEAVEIIKGSSSVKYGPRSTGGVVNLVSRSIPQTALAGRVDGALGEDGFRKLHGFVGGERNKLGAVIEGYHYGADGFKNLPNGADTGFEKTDLLTKIAGRFGAADAHKLQLKLSYADETSNETYAGLTDADYQAAPYRRYAASQHDVMNTEHNGYQLSYQYDLANGAQLSTTAYYNDFSRNWYKANQVGLTNLQAYSAFEANPTAEGINVSVRANNRNYKGSGIQSEFALPLGAHQLSFGGRLHQDEEDRFQWDDIYLLQQDLSMTLTSAGVPGTQDNRTASADALALYVHDEWAIDKLVLSGGLRYEAIDTEAENWNRAPDRNGASTVRKASSSIVLPSIGMTYRLNDTVVLLAGVQKGFSPAAPANAEQEEEESLNAELGVRYQQGSRRAEVVLFSSHYDNMHGNCRASTGCNPDNIGDQYNFGEVLVNGVEFSSYHQYQHQHYLIPIKLSYTFTDSEFQSNFDSDIFGSVEHGDKMPYVPQHQASLETGMVAEHYSVLARLSYVSSSHASLDDVGLDAIDSRVMLDLSAKYHLTPNQQLYMNVDNLLDKAYIANRANGGIQPGKPRTLSVGYRLDF